ncbi:hypothetical protein GGI22_003897, partial [Coemansia erecta]
VGGGRSSRRVSTSNSRSWSLSRPISRSGSHHQQQQQMQHPGARNGSEGLAENSTIVSSAATASIPGTIHSGFASGASSPRQQPQSPSSHMPPPSPMSLASTSRQRPSSSITTPQPDFSVSATPSTGGGGGGGSGRRLSRASVSTLPSPMLPPVYAVPIPGTPGPGNVISESVPHSASGSSLGAGFGVAGMANGGSTTSRIGSHSNQHSSTTHSYQHHEISEGTVTRMHQFMERYCNGVLEAVVKNPTGISSHSRRLGILVRLFQAYPRLKRLELSDFIMWDTQPLQLVSEQLHMLKSLDVTNRVELSDNDLLPVVEHCPRLRVLRIRATNATDVTIHAIINNLSHSLVSLNVGGCPVSSAAMSELVARCTKLRVLQMWSCLRLDDNFLLSLDPLVLGCLQVLDMMDVQKFSIEAVKRTFGRQSWPYLKYLRIRAKCDRDDFSGIPATAVYADTQHSTPSVASVSRPKYARLQTSTPDMARCAVLRELGTNNGFKLSPISQIRAEKENFDPVRKQFVCHKGAGGSRNGNTNTAAEAEAAALESTIPSIHAVREIHDESTASCSRCYSTQQSNKFARRGNRSRVQR